MWKFPGPPPGRPARVPQGPRRVGRPPIASKFSAEIAGSLALLYALSVCALELSVHGKKGFKKRSSFTLS